MLSGNIYSFLPPWAHLPQDSALLPAKDTHKELLNPSLFTATYRDQATMTNHQEQRILSMHQQR